LSNIYKDLAAGDSVDQLNNTLEDTPSFVITNPISSGSEIEHLNTVVLDFQLPFISALQASAVAGVKRLYDNVNDENNSSALTNGMIRHVKTTLKTNLFFHR
jgi:hypothetical protein